MQAIWKDIPEQNERLAKLGFESIQELQTLQDKFSRTAKLFSFCMNSKGEKNNVRSAYNLSNQMLVNHVFGGTGLLEKK